MTSIRNLAEERAAQILQRIRGTSIFRNSHPHYTEYPHQNLISGINTEDYSADLTSAAGNELVDDSSTPAKFCAAFSSSALAVNTFGPFRNHPNLLTISGWGGFTESCFEKTLPTGLRGTPPHLDFFARAAQKTICIESKFLEILWPKTAKFADSYEGAIEYLAEDCWQEVYAALKEDPIRYSYLDAAQLVKHYLGMRNSLEKNGRELLLFYVYWEPTNAHEIAEFVGHRREVVQFSDQVKNSRIRFAYKSYDQLWDEWLATSGWEGIGNHVEALGERYSFPI
jgi:hypothetical protein